MYILYGEAEYKLQFSNKVKQKIKDGNVALGGWSMTASPVVAEILAAAGFDWVCIDAEHSPVNMETIQNMIVAIENKGAEPFVRISLNGEKECKKILDAGAKGVIVPMVKSYEDVEKAISYVKYAPEGNRSFALPRATGYGIEKTNYFKQANDIIFMGIMIEHIDAVKDLNKIFDNDKIDTILVGPYDLSGSMGIPGQFESKEFQEVIDEINRKAAEYNVTMGIHEVHPTSDNLKQYQKDGYKFIACGIDTLFINDSAQKIISDFN